MSKKIGERVNFRLEVDAVSSWWGKPASRQDAEELARQIKRHCDADGIAILSDANDTCEHCGRDWTEESNLYNGGCCDADVAAEDARAKGES